MNDEAMYTVTFKKVNGITKQLINLQTNDVPRN